ncbi:uncharacterized protein LOC116029577 [Ipomoea triloba]|uniref:uncharacterized protein LOC116029576 n=1 Tax=Ipomoea triloba TaxID=35885 RepID=UPI00125D3423|nr:uncharacterized protein LOC116029576 [Ipomoea triloba]XP_031127487.1 uncharacterized protein LOC116029577 [Ipomoea triloba]
MTIISWNYRGVVNGRVRRHVKELLITSKADVLCLMEIRSPKVQGMTSLVNSLGYTNSFVVEPIGFAGGLLVVWKQGQIDLSVVSNLSQAIHTRIKNGSQEILFTFAYVRPNPFAKAHFWEYCKGIGSNLNVPWIVMGDLNDIAKVEEQWGSDSVNNTNLERFVDAYGSCGLIDPGYSGQKFTWSRMVGNRVTQMRRLDRVLWNVEAQLAFPKGKTVVLPRLSSDHNPLLFIDVAGTPPNNNCRPKRFEAAWLSRDDYGNIWKDATRPGTRDMVDVITDVTKQSFLWNQNVFGNIFKRKRQLTARIQGIQENVHYASSRGLQNLERKLLRELNAVLDQEETLWFQKSRRDWIKDGDRNTRYYHTSTMIRRNKSRVRLLKLQGEWTDDPLRVSTHIIDYFSALFCRSGRDETVSLSQINNSHKISQAQAVRLSRRVPEEEVKKAIFGMKKLGSPGPDGIPAVFYQHFWDDVGPALTKLVNQALDSGSVHKSLISACMTLIPKKIHTGNSGRLQTYHLT